jgi:hypothetical protein
VALARSHNKFGWHHLIHIAPDPSLTRLNRSDEWVTGMLKMLGGMSIFRIVTTANMTAREAHS